MFKKQVQYRINGLQKRKDDAVAMIARLETEIPKTQNPVKKVELEAYLTKIEESIPAFVQKLTDLAVQLENAEEDPTFPDA
jgi:hypothetical protein